MTADHMLHPLPLSASADLRRKQYEAVLERIKLLIEGEPDLVAVFSTIACELHYGFDYFHWTGFYQVLPREKDMLVIGPYQGSHGCLRIPLSRGVCGAAARTKKTQLVADVHAFPGHIACASSTQSEIVVPVFAVGGEVLGVLDVDSNEQAAFTEVDQQGLESIVGLLSEWNVFRERLPGKMDKRI